MIVAWHNDPGLKEEVLGRLREHRAADSIVQGVYQEVDPRLATGYRGCAVGCTLPRLTGEFQDWYARLEELYGIPESVAYLIDGIFEGLPTAGGVHARFAVEVIEAIPVGADLSLVPARVMLDVLVDPVEGVARFTAPGGAQRAAVEAVAGYAAFDERHEHRIWQAGLLIDHLTAAPIGGAR